MEIVLARVDSRLLHGQVATTWTQAVHPTRILVVSDTICHDTLRKDMIKQAAPPGVRANVIPLSKLIQIIQDPRFGGTKALVLFETLQDALKAIEQKVPISTLNIGSVAYVPGKVTVTSALALNQEDVQTLYDLQKLSVDLDVRKVPSDAPEDMDAILRKAKSLL